MDMGAGEENHVGEVLVYICWGGYVEVRSNGGLTYHGGRRDDIWLRGGMGIGNVMKVVEEVMGECLGERRLCFNTKYNRSMILLLQRDVDVWKLTKGNDEFAYMHVVGADRPIRKKVEDSELVRGMNLEGGSSGVRKGCCVDVGIDGGDNGGGRACMVVNGR